jgi:Arsenical pump membrane protein
VIVAIAGNLMNNLPVGLIAGNAVQGARLPEPVTRAVVIGVDLGPNLSVTGSLATILWLTALRREGRMVGVGTFLKLGACHLHCFWPSAPSYCRANQNLERSAYAEAPTSGQSPQELDAEGKAADELKRLFDFTSEVVNRRKDVRILNSLTRREAELNRLFDSTRELMNKGWS